MAKIRLFFQSNKQDISPEDFQIFLEQFTRGEPLEAIALCKRLKEDWWEFVDCRKFRDYIEIDKLPNAKCIPKDLPGNNPGIYSIFAEHPFSDFPQCFYVGISTADVRGRIRTHLSSDIETNYRGGFHWLSECSEIFICYALMSKIQKKELKSKLGLLESCLTVILRPRFLIITARG